MEIAMKLITAVLFILSTAIPARAADVSGEWQLTATVLNDVTYARLTLKADGDTLTGTFNEMTLAGTVKGDEVTFTATRPNGDRFGEFKGRMKGDDGSGTASGPAIPPGASWTAARAKKSSGSPRTHRFEPTEFHRLFSEAIPPVLHISPGDTVSTWTIDAGGRDSKGVRRSQGGNPETGPFFIEGAFPGDTLVVKLNKVRLNRDSAGSGARIVPTALNPGYVGQTKYQDNFDSEWILDRANGIARLKNPSERLKNYTVKLQPMIGCIAVAPPGHQALRTGYPGVFGGNMDYNQIREGTTVYLPVFVPGALLFIGDGHAAQGDGELTGDALETSMDVEFTVELVTGRASGGPRAENDDYLMSSGIGNSLPDALQLATTQLVNWLQTDYHLSPNEASVVLGTAMRYDIAEVVDPLVHIVAKIRKDAVAQLK
jgi:acetamidase/formamidase